MIFRIEKTKDYTVMSNYHLRDKNLSLKAKGLLSWMLSNTDDWDYSLAGIVACCKEGETTVNTALKELQKCGYVVIHKHKPDKTTPKIHYDYDVYERPQSTENQGVENQGVENQGVENQGVENQVQINTNTINTNKEKTNTKVLVADKPALFNSKTIQSNKSTNKKSLYEKCISFINTYTENIQLRNVLVDYLNFRLQITDKPIYSNQFKGMLNKLVSFKNEYGYNEDDLINCVQQSIDRGYLSFYPVNKKSGFAEKYKDPAIFIRPDNRDHTTADFELADESF